MANCPKCPDETLRPTLLAEGLAAKGCPSCDGVLLSLVAFRAWTEPAGIDDAQATLREPTAGLSADDTREAIRCPKCARIMTKYKLSAAVQNRLDYCAHCEEVWLDGGEWALLAELAVREHLGAIFTEPWQRRVRQSGGQALREARLRERLGEDYAKFVEFRAWLMDLPFREEVLAMLASGTRR